MKKDIRLWVQGCLLLFFLLPGWLPASGQTARMYTVRSGLHGSSVSNISQDDRGFVWLATGAGLERFDGSTFDIFSHREEDPASIRSNQVNAFLEDASGTIWVGTSSGLDQYDYRTGSFRHYPLVPEDYIVSVAGIFEFRSTRSVDYVLVQTRADGIFVINERSGRLDPGMKARLDAFFQKDHGPMFLDSSSRLWLSPMDGELKAMDLDTMDPVPLTLQSGVARDLASTTVTAYAENPETGRVYIGTFDQGIYVFAPDAMTVSRSRGADGRKLHVNALILKTYNVPRASTLVVGTEDAGIQLYDTESEDVVYMERAGIPYRTTRMKVSSLLEDRQGNLWVGAYYSGVLVIPETVYGFTTHRLNPIGIPGENDACITGITEDAGRGYIYIGTDGGGIYRYSTSGSYEHFDRQNSGLSNDSVMALETDSRGRLWAATYIGGLFTYTPAEGFRQFLSPDAFGSERLWSLAYDPARDLLYVGTVSDGLFVVDASARKIIGRVEGTAGRWINALYVDPDGTLWIGTRTGALYYDPASGRAREFEVGESWRYGLVYDFCDSQDGFFWLCTSRGLLRLNDSTHEVKLYTRSNVTADPGARAALAGSDGELWVSYAEGLTKLDRDTGESVDFYVYDGLQDGEFYGAAAFKSSEGRMYFGGKNGLSMFSPQLLNLNVRRPGAIHLSSLYLMDEKTDGIPRICVADTVTVPKWSNVFSLGFAVPEYMNPGRVRYDVRLSRHDKDWIRLDGGSPVTYMNVAAGQHVLQVRAFLEGNERAYSYKEFIVRVHRPWYVSWWARILFGLSLLAALATSVYAVIRWRKMQKVRKAAQINEMRLEMYSNITHEIRTPLFLVLSPLKELLAQTKDPALRETYSLMHRNSLRVNQIVDQLMDLRKVDEGKLRLYFQQTDIVSLIRDVVGSFDGIIRSKQIEVESDLPDRLDLWIDRDHFDKVLFNILSNAFKFTPEGGRVRVSASTSEGSALIRIYNSGSHIPEEDLERIFGRFVQSGGTVRRGGSGIGLSLTSQLVSLHHGQVRAENGDGGVTFTITLPEGCSHLTAEELSDPGGSRELSAVRPGDLLADMLPTHLPEEASSGPLRRKWRIVIVDDDDDTRAFLLKAFQDYNAVAYADGTEAWSALVTDQVDAVITDLKMDAMDGLTLVRKIRKNPLTAHVPVIILTSTDDENAEQRCSESGADKFFVKPVSTELLRSGVAQVISARESVRIRAQSADSYDYHAMKLTPVDGQLKAKVLACIEANLGNPDFDVDDLSESVGISRVHLNRKLRSLMDISPAALIRRTRLKQAAFLLMESEQPNVSEIAYKVGFSTQSYFSTSFHDYFGMTPSEFAAVYSDPAKRAEIERLFAS